MTDLPAPKALLPLLRRAALVCTRALALVIMAAAARAEPLTVFAAASLKTALDEAATVYEQAGGPPVRMSYAGSSALARQIELGAPADLFISANPGWMDHLQQNGLIEGDTRRDLLGNALVLIAPAGAPALPLPLSRKSDLTALLGPDDRLAMALVDAVPVGIYGKAALSWMGQWQALAPQVAQTDNARAALALVATGEAPLGIVYATDAAAEPRVTILGTFPADSHPPIIYPAAAIAGGQTGPAQDFLRFLNSPVASAAFERQGFVILNQNEPQ